MTEKRKKLPKRQKLPKGVMAMCDTPDDKLIKDIQLFIDVGLISNIEAVSYSLAILYSSLNEEDKKDLAIKTCELSKMVNDFFTASIAEKEGSSVAFLFALLYMTANMNATLMFDEHWKNLVEKGIECKQKVLQKTILPIVVDSTKKKNDDNRGYC